MGDKLTSVEIKKLIETLSVLVTEFPDLDLSINWLYKKRVQKELALVKEYYNRICNPDQEIEIALGDLIKRIRKENSNVHISVECILIYTLACTRRLFNEPTFGQKRTLFDQITCM